MMNETTAGEKIPLVTVLYCNMYHALKGDKYSDLCENYSYQQKYKHYATQLFYKLR